MSVVGTGYLGATHAACMAALGHDVIGIDTDPAKVAALSSGTVPFWEPGLDTVLQDSLRSGRLHFTTDVTEATDAAVHFICVGTPQRSDSPAADLTHVHGAVSALLPILTPESLVVGKSTVPVGTAAEIADHVAATGARVAWNPEFLREGHAVDDTLHPDRLVFGVRDAISEATLCEVYATLLADGTPLLVTDFATAELVKVSANAFLATKISFINAMAEVCEATGGDILTLSTALGLDPRIGPQFLRAGLGFGGGCLPKDIRAFMARAGELGVDEALMFLRNIDDINIRRRQHTVDLTIEALNGSARGRRVAAWGAAFKPDSDDVRDSPALHVAAALREAGADVVVHDPRAMDNARRLFPDLSYAASALDAARDADVVLLLTEWRDYNELDPAEVAAVTRQASLIDARNALDVDRWRSAGWTYRALGRPLA
ncbi:MAG: UDP-glucose/GDP-mannose dehydrogenase family protein [Candidatus Nanopelagicales bacterium]|jgi:UDPglucose 6-dehydrogenase|nr:UDP-glucose/GDP-mannose dehydrogenase family protein [Candidatus Nanopelagicales bacterium]MDP4715148.1 UDP-glucose/GDP-mannose dehydrogenase family protein [Candidatus Nanopelagicales bacterium]MDP4907069.1 UDP-glucose/GDP-mannose dehydrogenase family protein [Candidatus Nanopelagicales bacterium]MDP4908022.1 UDP-glucose/GDP-mannose dehydrogenase family protein [Candidatus Nanopelagicales bacterium]MDP4974253.1 UDP-glucose/GDP-mannose dehydrogenase family protein [Candidatus Nanopelagicales